MASSNNTATITISPANGTLSVNNLVDKRKKNKVKKIIFFPSAEIF